MELLKFADAAGLPCILACFTQLFSPYRPLPASEPQVKAEEHGSRFHDSWREVPLVRRFDLLKRVGKGGFSEIWLAAPRGAGAGGVRHEPGPAPSPPLPPARRVVLKVVNLAHPDLEPEEVTTLMSEAKYLRSLDCPHLPRCYAAEVGPPGCATAPSGDGRGPSAAAARGPPAPPLRRPRVLVLALEHLAGGELLEGAARVARYTEARAAGLFAQAVAAVAYLHALNIMHRDIKPENIVFVEPVEAAEAGGRPLRVKVIDLGMAAQYDPKKEIRGCIGTPGFVAPELWHDEPHTPAADVYSLGVVLFVMLTGRKPHAGGDIRTMAYCDKPIAQAPGFQDERFLALSPAARDLLVAMLADDPLRRPSAAAVLRHPFLATAEGGGAGAGGDSAQREMGEVVRRRMRELAQLRRAHGLRHALRAVRRPGAASEGGAGHHDPRAALLAELEQRRLRLKRESSADAGGAEGAEGGGGLHPLGAAAAAAEPGLFARGSLAASYAAPPPLEMHVRPRSRPPSRLQSTHGAAPGAAAPGARAVAVAAAASAGAAGAAPALARPSLPLAAEACAPHAARCSGGSLPVADTDPRGCVGNVVPSGSHSNSHSRGCGHLVGSGAGPPPGWPSPHGAPAPGPAPSFSRSSLPASPRTADAPSPFPSRHQPQAAAPSPFARVSAPPAALPARDAAMHGHHTGTTHAAVAAPRTPRPSGGPGGTHAVGGSCSGDWAAAPHHGQPSGVSDAWQGAWRPGWRLTHGSAAVPAAPAHSAGISGRAPPNPQDAQQGAAEAYEWDDEPCDQQDYHQQHLHLEQPQLWPPLSACASPLSPHPPALLHCPSMPSPGLDAGGGLSGGGSPVAPPGVVEAALIPRCMSANPLALALLLARQDTLERAARGGGGGAGEDEHLAHAAIGRYI